VAKDGTILKPLPVGSETEVFICWDKYKYYITDIKSVVAAIATSDLGELVEPKQVTEKDCKHYTSPAQPGKGVQFRGTFTVKPGKFTKDGMPVTTKKFEGILEAGANAAA
jgi:hypothetical protein